MVKVSIILCVYNGEKFIKNAIESVLNQTLDDIELIVINDGSEDDTEKIIRSFDSEKIRLFNQTNQGLGKSRNRGMKLAKGEYIAFLDADDYLKEEMCEITYKEAKSNDTDITMFQILNFNESKTYESDWFNLKNIDFIEERTVFNKNDTKEVLFDFSVSACQKIYRTSFLKEIDARFPEGIYFEDMPFFYYVYLKAERISIIRRHLYMRRDHDSSITKNLDAKFLDTVRAGQILFDIFTENGFYEDYKLDLIAYKINGPRMTLSGIDEKYRDEMFKLIRNDYENIRDSEYFQDYLDNLGPKKRKFFIDVLNSESYEEFSKVNENKY